jgi:O-antigen/teichoic acid export membrane protein
MASKSARARIANTLSALGRGPVARGSLWGVGFRIAIPLLGFVQAVLTARLLGPEGYGIVAVALSVATIAATIALLGFGNLAVREVARLSASRSWGALRGFLHFAGSTLFVTSLLGGGALAALAFGTSLVSAPYRPAIGLASLCVPLVALITYFRAVCVGFGSVVLAQCSGDLLRYALTVCCLAMFFFLDLQLTTIGYLYVVLLVTGLVTCVMAWIARNIAIARIQPATAEFRRREWWSAAGPFLVLSLFGILATEFTTLLLGWLTNPAETGLFQPIARLTPFMLIGMQAIVIPYSSRVAELWERGETDRLKDITAKATIAATASALVTCVAIIGFGSTILSAFGPDFSIIAPALWWVAAAQVFSAACGPVTELLTMTKYEWAATKAQAAALGVTTIVGLAAIPHYGAHGAAMSLAAGIVVWNCIMLIAVYRKLDLDPSILASVRLFAPQNT